MTTFDELYKRLLKASLENNVDNEIENIKLEEYDETHLDCLLNPKKYAAIWNIGKCSCSNDKNANCVDKCLFDAIKKDDNGNVIIDKDLCVGCSACIDSCAAKKLTESRDILPALKSIHESKGPVYILIAPAFLGQFSKEVTPGKLRTAFKKLGFDGMIEVALFADILTLKEALEFEKNIKTESDYQLTSCCCPMWIAMIRKIYHDLMPHVPGAVSPMIACGRTVKLLHPDCTTIFVGPCIAKKSEAREPDLIGAIDYVLTFQEVQNIFEFANINPAEMEDTIKDHSSKAGRIYARTGGVSEAVKSTVERLDPNRKITVHTQQANGVAACKQMINDLLEGKTTANFFEGMGCVGGCVGGPKVIINREEGTKHVNDYGDEATYVTPIDNPYVIDLLKRIGFDTVESLVESSDIFTRTFDKPVQKN